MRLLLARDNMYVYKAGQGHHVNGYSWPGTPRIWLKLARGTLSMVVAHQRLHVCG